MIYYTPFQCFCQGGKRKSRCRDFFFLELMGGFEPPTCRLRISCSASWATLAHCKFSIQQYSTFSAVCQEIFCGFSDYSVIPVENFLNEASHAPFRSFWKGRIWQSLRHRVSCPAADRGLSARKDGLICKWYVNNEWNAANLFTL